MERKMIRGADRIRGCLCILSTVLMAIKALCHVKVGSQPSFGTLTAPPSAKKTDKSVDTTILLL